MRRIITLLLAASLLLLAASCSASPHPAPSSSDTDQTAVSGSSVPEKVSHYRFQPKVCSPLMEEVMGTGMKQAWFSLVDAIMEGRDSFECPDRDTYDWMMGQFPYRCFPVIDELIESSAYPFNGVKGTAGFCWKVPEDEARRKIEEFITLTEDILNEALDDDYTDVEKALALYVWFEDHYEYDYDTYEQMSDHYIEDISAYRLMTTGKGICQEVSTAYSFLLMQAGVDATVMMGERSYDHANHQWSYVRINGRTYHIDPTYALQSGHYLGYFMMTDLQRYNCDSYSHRFPDH